MALRAEIKFEHLDPAGLTEEESDLSRSKKDKGYGVESRQSFDEGSSSW